MPISRRAMDSQDFYFLIAFSGLFCSSWGRCVKIGLGIMSRIEYIYSLIPQVRIEFLWLPVIMCSTRHIQGCHVFSSDISLDTLFCVNSRMLWLPITLIYGSVRNRIQCVRLCETAGEWESTAWAHTLTWVGFEPLRVWQLGYGDTQGAPAPTLGQPPTLSRAGASVRSHEVCSLSFPGSSLAL